ncbi:type II toxin-antitoxin system RelB/DinJ family antitoxin [Acinetobacter sp. B5B]|jgi:DNA-damage-inducible protein J|uniref:type II toxin-antitoxin system RelB/DinJ family antitoxin n=1 Tax=Acinetobacter baretiae TaxID=2605383 RepID=UPI0018C1D185|nr:type II toxin-antitoxin system RelB/DinJ family antitoxin [Acinetobacter baretiae]MBF7684086.1 type II toxin-antitoxin system RelB/DinJ family antitoxin [Acinetobacter baretiae]
MSTAIKDQYVRARVPQVLKENAEEILQQVGLSTSDAIRLLLTQVVNRGQFPLELQMPNQITIDAMQSEVEPEVYVSSNDLFKDILG